MASSGRQQIRIIAGRLDAFSTRLIKRLALNLNANLIEDTPKDTGWAQANWVLTIGEAFSGTAGTRAAAEAGSIDISTQAAGEALIATSYKLGPTIHETNNVPYIQSLNAGSSTQAPIAFVQGAIVRAIQQSL